MADPGLATRAQATAKGDMSLLYGELALVPPTYPSMEALGQSLSISKKARQGSWQAASAL